MKFSKPIISSNEIIITETLNTLLFDAFPPNFDHPHGLHGDYMEYEYWGHDLADYMTDYGNKIFGWLYDNDVVFQIYVQLIETNDDLYNFKFVILDDSLSVQFKMKFG